MRDFTQTPEPSGELGSTGTALLFVVQKHAARNLHYDFRLELGGSLKSWAVPKGPSLDPTVKRMAVQVEDHPLAYANFEGVIPAKRYGAGTVILWDRGTWVAHGDPYVGYAQGKLKFELHGVKLRGNWALVRMKPREGESAVTWLLMKERDASALPTAVFDVLEARPESVRGLLSDLKATQVTAEVSFAQWTQRGRVRHAVSRGLRGDKPAESITREKTVAVPTKLPARLHVTHAERVIDPESGVTKGELVAYYASVAHLMLPHLKARPVALLRAPGGVTGPQFFQKHADSTELPGLQRLAPDLDPGHEPLLAIGSAAGLLMAAQMNVIEVHSWNMTTRAIQKSDRMVFDLDPGEGVAWQAVYEAAQLLRAFLTELGLKSFLKTSGGKGLHVVAPLAPRHEWQVVKQFARAIVLHMAGVLPDRLVAKSGPKNRVGRIFIDYLRNGWGATTAVAWSARARPGMGVSVPVAWDELDALSGATHWTVRNVALRLDEGNRSWDGYTTSRQGLTRAMKTLGFTPQAPSTVTEEGETAP